jgi:hypothetical protein
MKGIIFTEFLKMVEEDHGYELVDEILNKEVLESNGIYTAVGTYQFSEMLTLISNLGEKLDKSANDLLYVFGKYFFKVILNSYMDIVNSYSNPVEFLASVDSHIHVHVRKIYPNAELPTFDTITQKENYMHMNYYSQRSMSYFAKGLMEETFSYYDYKCEIEMTPLNEDASEVEFHLHF